MIMDLSHGMTPVSTRVMNLSHLLTESARRAPGDIGLVWGEQSWTWAELDARATAFARVLAQDYGVAKGDRVLVQSANCNQMFEAVFGCWRAGAVWVPANFRQSPDDVAYLAAILWREGSAVRGGICRPRARLCPAPPSPLARQSSARITRH